MMLRTLVTALALAALCAPAIAQTKPKTALAPPAIGQRDPEAPPEGRGPGGLDFGAWRSQPAQRTAGAFAAEVARLGESGDVRARLAANGFRCLEPTASSGRWTCARSALEGACGYDWTVTAPAPAALPTAQFSAHCLPAPR